MLENPAICLYNLNIIALLIPSSARLSIFKISVKRPLIPEYSKPKSLIKTACNTKLSKLLTNEHVIPTKLFIADFLVLL